MAPSAGAVAMPEELLRFCSEAFQSAGVPEPDARLVADTLVQADLRGVETHGVVRLRNYVDRLHAGGMAAETRVQVLSDGGATLLLDGQNGIGQVVAAHAMEMALERAGLHGIACVAVRGSNHAGALAYYSRMALPLDMVGFATSGGPIRLAPTGGLTPLLTTGPWSIALPADQELPIVIDFANASLNSVKIQDLVRRGERLPAGIALDEAGNPTEDPGEALKGIVLPIGGHKGYGLALAMEVLTSILTGAVGGTSAARYDELGLPRRLGHLMLAVRIDRFVPVAQFKSRVDDLIRRLHASRRLPGIERIFVPGERSELLARARARGIPLEPWVADILRGLAQDLSIPAPFLDG